MYRRVLKKPYAALYALTLLLLVTACSQPVNAAQTAAELPQTIEQTGPETTEQTVETEPAEIGFVNPLTGLRDGIGEDKLSRKPVAIMINNLRESLPQHGISKADIVFEMLAEGRISRFLAVYQDPSDVLKIGSIRSARIYYIDMAEGLNAVFMHFGAAETAYDDLKTRKITALDGLRGGLEGTLFYRDPVRLKTYSMEHTVFTTGARIEEYFKKLKNLEVKDYEGPFAFSVNGSAANGNEAAEITIPYSTYITAKFEYDETEERYLRYQFGKPHMDAEYGCQVSAKNVVVLKMETSNVKGSYLGWIDIKTTGSGTGFYACDGRYIKIKWSKASKSAPLILKTEDGQPLRLEPGNTFICVAPTETVIKFG